MTSSPSPPPFPNERTINAAWTRSMYAETSKAMDSFQSEVSNVWNMPRRLRPAELAYCGHPPKSTKSFGGGIADIDLATFEQRDREDSVRRDERGVQRDPLKKERTHEGEGKGEAVSAKRSSATTLANEEHEQIAAGRKDGDDANASSGRFVNAIDCDEQTKEEEDLAKLCDWSGSTIYLADSEGPKTTAVEDGCGLPSNLQTKTSSKRDTQKTVAPKNIAGAPLNIHHFFENVHRSPARRGPTDVDGQLRRLQEKSEDLERNLPPR